MDNPEVLAVVGVILLTTVLLLLLTRRLQGEGAIALRPLPPYDRLQKQVGRALESGRQLHLTAGRAPLPGPAAPTSIAALQILGYLAAESSRSGVSPLATVGDATLLPIAQASLRHPAAEATNGAASYRWRNGQFVAAENYPFAYAAGVAATLSRDPLGNNVAVGRFGQELAIFAEAARRREMTQIIGTDDPAAMAIGFAYTDDVLWGEELLIAGAYLEGSPLQLASARVQDLLRWLIAAAILLVALLRVAGVL